MAERPVDKRRQPQYQPTKPADPRGPVSPFEALQGFGPQGETLARNAARGSMSRAPRGRTPRASRDMARKQFLGSMETSEADVRSSQRALRSQVANMDSELRVAAETMPVGPERIAIMREIQARRREAQGNLNALNRLIDPSTYRTADDDRAAQADLATQANTEARRRAVMLRERAGSMPSAFDTEAAVGADLMRRGGVATEGDFTSEQDRILSRQMQRLGAAGTPALSRALAERRSRREAMLSEADRLDATDFMPQSTPQNRADRLGEMSADPRFRGAIEAGRGERDRQAEIRRAQLEIERANRQARVNEASAAAAASSAAAGVAGDPDAVNPDAQRLRTPIGPEATPEAMRQEDGMNIIRAAINRANSFFPRAGEALLGANEQEVSGLVALLNNPDALRMSFDGLGLDQVRRLAEGGTYGNRIDSTIAGRRLDRNTEDNSQMAQAYNRLLEAAKLYVRGEL